MHLPCSCHAITMLLPCRYNAVIIKPSFWYQSIHGATLKQIFHCPTQHINHELFVTSVQAVWHNPHVVVLRDQDTIQALAKRLPDMRRVVLVGNGGIALEVAHSLTGVEVDIPSSIFSRKT